MFARLMILVGLLLIFAQPTLVQGQWPPYLDLETACEGDDFILRVNVMAYDPDLTLTVRRQQSAPDMLGELVLAADIPVPYDGAYHEFLIADPGIGPRDIGFHEASLFIGDYHFGTISAQLSCYPDPYLMRGWLDSSFEFVPCADVGLLECETVELLYGDMNTHIRSGELLEIYGWTQNFDARDDCSVLVTRIESLGPNVYCEDVVAASTTSWGTLKARYR